MTMTRRRFIATMGGSGLFYAFRLGSTPRRRAGSYEAPPSIPNDPDCNSSLSLTEVDFSECIAIAPGNRVTLFTGRTELGQGLRTLLVAIVTQGLEISADNLTLNMGDTDLCPDHGSTAGSSSTRDVVWGFWLACEKIRSDLVARAAQRLGIPASELEYDHGIIRRKEEKRKLFWAYELGRGETVHMEVDLATPSQGKEYQDIEIPNVNAQKIVTGALKFAGDVYPPGVLYAGWQIPPYHPSQTRLQSADMDLARDVPGVKLADTVHGRPVVVAERYGQVQKALGLVRSNWAPPERKRELPLEDARQRAVLLDVKDERGDIDAGLGQSDFTLTETYTTSYTIHAAVESDMAVARIEKNGRVTVWASSQHPHKAREMVAEYLDVPESDVRIVGMAVGGGFGGKQANPVNREAARLSRLADAPVKLIYSRKDQFQIRGLYKAACIVDVSGGARSDGTLLARKVDVFQDVGDGTRDTYNIPNTLVKAYRNPDWPVGIAVTRCTSFVQTCFATESHIDMMAHGLGLDPLEFRRSNAALPVFVELIDACAEMIGYGSSQLEADEGIGTAMIAHGPQFGVVAVRAKVDRATGRVTLKHICGAFDIGTIMNRRTVTAGICGAVNWGIGYALKEQVVLDGHSTQTAYFSQYDIPRFSDIPPIDVRYLDVYSPGAPRGCGEMPAIPTIGAIANAVYNAVGVRIYSIPMTPEKIKQALGGA